MAPNKNAMKLRLMPIFARMKFRFDLGQGFLSLATFGFVAAERISIWLHLPVWVSLLIALPLAVVGVGVLGFILDKLKFYDAYTAELNARNDMLKSVCKTKAADGH